MELLFYFKILIILKPKQLLNDFDLIDNIILCKFYYFNMN
jgi:hypothetical protein